MISDVYAVLMKEATETAGFYIGRGGILLMIGILLFIAPLSFPAAFFLGMLLFVGGIATIIQGIFLRFYRQLSSHKLC